jgi:uncharacterized protein
MPRTLRRLRHRSWRVALLALAAVLCGCTSLFLQPDHQTYFGGRGPGTPTEDVWLATPDGLRLHAQWLPTRTAPRATILFLHGNAENLSSHISAVAWLPAQGYAVLALDYRGYGRSEGSASVDRLHDDAMLALRWLIARDGDAGGSVIVYGQSLGAAVAINLVARADAATRSRIGAVIADSGFAGYRGIAREKLAEAWLTWPLQWPLSLLVSDAWSPLPVVDRISPIPLLLIHGERDAVVPLHHAEQLYKRACEPKTLWRVPGGQHIDAVRRADLRARLLDDLGRVTAAEPPPGQPPLTSTTPAPRSTDRAAGAGP